MTATPKCSPEMATKVWYEFSMFRFLYGRIKDIANSSAFFIPGEWVQAGTSPASDDEARLAYAELESFLLHARVLRDFFWEPKARWRADDVAAPDFIPDWVAAAPSMGRYLASREERLNKALAHLSVKRVEYDTNDKPWNVTAIYAELQPVIERFLSQLPEAMRQWFAKPPDPDY